MDGVRHQRFSSPQDGGLLLTVIQSSRGEEVSEEHGVAQYGTHRWRGPSCLLVAGR